MSGPADQELNGEIRVAEDLPNVQAIASKLAELNVALASRRSRVTCLRRWSEFVRERDGHRCVDCQGRRHLSAHHISRKSLFASAQYQTGNGITLCRDCHKDAHRGFNGRPAALLPVDAQGGEKLPVMERLYSILLQDAVERRLLREDFYFISDELLWSFKTMQGYDETAHFPGPALEQAYLILAEPERCVRSGVAAANGFTLPHGPLLPGGVVLGFKNDQQLVIQTYKPQPAPPSPPSKKGLSEPVTLPSVIGPALQPNLARAQLSYSVSE